MPTIDEIKQYNDWTIIPSNFDDTYVATKNICKYELNIPEDMISRLKECLEEENIFLGNDIVLKEMIAGLVKGNLILQGPPGTGKTSIARILCKMFNADPNECTAVSDWTSYDTIGGLQPTVNESNEEIVVGKCGRVVESILNCCNTVLSNVEGTGEIQASWLIIDELNRCEIDKAFGELFTIFGSDSPNEEQFISLWYENDENKKKIYVPRRFRIIGAMNNVDKNFVFDMSQGLTRRFTFVSILPPELKYFDKEIENVKIKAVKRVLRKLNNYKNYDSENKIKELFDERIFQTAELIMLDFLKHIRYSAGVDYLGLQLGTAQIIDLYENVLLNMILFDYTDSSNKEEDIHIIIDTAMCDRIIPQMDGYDYVRLADFYNYVSRNGQYEWLQKTKESIESKQKL